MDYVADLHLHSHYSRAVSKDMNLITMSTYAKKKGLELLTTSDWTHPLWLREIRSQLIETKEGIYSLKSQVHNEQPVSFLLSVEIACIFSQGGKSRRIHNLVFVPNLEIAEKINQELLKHGCNLSSDGRPIIGLSSKQLLSLILEVDERAMLIPAHIWTPWFGLFGANSGFDSIDEAFEDLSSYIYAIETGLSSDPEMNWQIKELNTRSILSFSDAHSAPKMGREATVFRLKELNYGNIREAIMAPMSRKSYSIRTESHGRRPNLLLSGEEVMMKENNHVLYTIEFYPEEGKYHYNGHRKCNIYQTPEETKEKGEICPVCKRRITVGVMQRVQDIAYETIHSVLQKNREGLHWLKDPKGNHPPFVKIVPLNEIIAEAMDVGVSTMKVKAMFSMMCETLGSELEVLLQTPIKEIEKVCGEKIAEGVEKVRAGNIVIHPGYDNVYGRVKIWGEEKEIDTSEKDQLGIDF